MFSPLIILFYFHFNQIKGFESNNNESIISNITFQTALDVDNHYHLFWTVDYETQSVTLEVRSVLEDKYGWFAIGFSDYGDIGGADLCILWTDKRFKTHFQVSCHLITKDNNLLAK